MNHSSSSFARASTAPGPTTFGTGASGSSSSLLWLPLLGFLPILGRGFWHAFRSEGSLNLRRIGYLEVLYTILFTILMGAGVLVDGF
ncbi:MAG: hypothetical protein P8Z74_00735 [Acidobacteriota bacterium]